MIIIKIEIKEDKVATTFHEKETTLVENAIAVRALEELKLKLLDIEYVNEFEMNWGDRDEGDRDYP